MYPVSFPGAKEIKKPDNMTDEECMSIWAQMGYDTLFRMMQLGPMIPSWIESGKDTQKFPYFLTAWLPNKEDLDSLNSGRPIFIKTISHGLPPMNVFTLDENEYPNYHPGSVERIKEDLKIWEELFEPIAEYFCQHPEGLSGGASSITYAQFVLARAKKYDEGFPKWVNCAIRLPEDWQSKHLRYAEDHSVLEATLFEEFEGTLVKIDGDRTKRLLLCEVEYLEEKQSNEQELKELREWKEAAIRSFNSVSDYVSNIKDEHDPEHSFRMGVMSRIMNGMTLPPSKGHETTIDFTNWCLKEFYPLYADKWKAKVPMHGWGEEAYTTVELYNLYIESFNNKEES